MQSLHNGRTDTHSVLTCESIIMEAGLATLDSLADWVVAPAIGLFIVCASGSKDMVVLKPWRNKVKVPSRGFKAIMAIHRIVL